MGKGGREAPSDAAPTRSAFAHAVRPGPSAWSKSPARRWSCVSSVQAILPTYFSSAA